MKYWFIIDDNRIGPVSPEEAVKLPLTPDTPVWSDGLPDWTTCGQLPEIVRLMQGEVSPINIHPGAQPYSAHNPYQQPYAQPQQPMSAYQPRAQECPSTHLAWCIVCTILFNMLFGVIGIICSVQVKSAWRRGDYKRARSLSEWSEWCIMLSITIGLAFWPIQMVMQMM